MAADSARHLLTLADACTQLEKIEFVSTVGVGGRTHGTVPEEWLHGRREFHNTYEQAKAEAEQVVFTPQLERGRP